MTRSVESIDPPIQLSEEQTKTLHDRAVGAAVHEYDNVDQARRTASWQSAFGINGVLLFGSLAAIAATVATAGVAAPTAAALIVLAESSGIMTGTSAILTLIGQAREKINNLRYRKNKKRFNMKPALKPA